MVEKVSVNKLIKKQMRTSVVSLKWIVYFIMTQVTSCIKIKNQATSNWNRWKNLYHGFSSVAINITESQK